MQRLSGSLIPVGGEGGGGDRGSQRQSGGAMSSGEHAHRPASGGSPGSTPGILAALCRGTRPGRGRSAYVCRRLREGEKRQQGREAGSGAACARIAEVPVDAARAAAAALPTDCPSTELRSGTRERHSSQVRLHRPRAGC